MPPAELMSDFVCPSCGSHARSPDGRCAGCRAEIAGDCPGCAAAALRLAKFCWRCGQPLSGGVPAGGANRDRPAALSRRPVTVMFCDFVGSSALSIAMDPEDYGEVLGRCHAMVAEIIAAHDGFAAQYMGDGTLAYFGYPRSGEDDAARAIQAGLAILQAIPHIKALDKPISARIGIAAGVVLAGDIVGAGNPRGLDMAGDVPNLAARLQSAAGPDDLIACEAVRAATSRLFDAVPISGLVLKGWKDPVTAWRITGPAPVPAEGAMIDSVAMTPLFGRDKVMTRLLALWQEVKSGAGRAVVIAGEMGIGKTRLVAELLHATESDAHARQRWFCTRTFQGVPLHPFVQQLERAAGIAPEDSQAARHEKIGALLVRESALNRSLISELVAPGVAPLAVSGMSANKRRDLTLAALLERGRGYGADDPVLAVFEDYHWADPTSRELLALAVRNMAAIPGLLVVTVRPGAEPEWIHDRSVRHVTLDALGAADAARLAGALAPHANLPRQTLQRIVDRCDGVPLFIEEVTRATLQGPAAAPSRLTPAGPLPLSIHASLTSRLDGLGAARETAEVASVIGRDFSAELLARVTNRPDTAIRADIARMLASGLIKPGTERGASGFRFKHALIHDAAYDSMIRSRRAALHGRVARTITDAMPAIAEAQPQLLANHFTEAGDAAAAVTWWLAAATRSLQQSATAEGLDQLNRGLELLAAQPEDDWRRRSEMALLICKAKAYVATAGHASDAVAKNFGRARMLCETLPGLPQLLPVTFGEWSHYVTRGPLRQAAKLASNIRGLAEASGDPVQRMFGLYSSGMTDTVIGNLGTARGFLQGGIDACGAMEPASYLVPAVGDPKPIMRAYLAMIGMCEGKSQESRQNIALALREAQATKLSYSMALSLTVRVMITAFGGAPDEGDGDLDALRDFAGQRGMVFFEAIEISLRGWAIARRGDHAAGLRMLHDGLTRYRDTRSGVWTWTFLRMQGEMQGWLGRPDDGLVSLDAADRAAEAADAAFEQSVLLRARGQLLAQSGQRDAAESAFARAAAAAGGQGAHLFARQAEEARARALLPPAPLVDHA